MSNGLLAKNGIIVTGSIEVQNAVTASAFSGDGSALTGIETDPFPYSGSITVTGSLTLQGTLRNDYVTQSFQYDGSNLTQITASFANGTEEITNINYTGSNIDNIAITGSDGINKLYTLSYDGSGNVTNIIVS
jgi:hypothetical protein